MIPRLGEAPDAPFPDPESALETPDGLLAWGGGLEPQRLLRAYRSGIFPWYSDDDPILWWSPADRCVIPTDGVHVSRRLARTLKQSPYRLTMDCAFGPVLQACGHSRESTWITPAMERAYQQLHELGYAHSIEAWDGEELAGGLYGVSLGRCFFGESMFSAQRDASKVVLVQLCRVLSSWAFPVMDCQVHNPHLSSMGAINLPRPAFLKQVRRLAVAPDRRGPWTQAFAEAQEAL